MTLFVGLTGSIGMGKSTTAQIFMDLGVPVYDSDATVHALYNSEAVPLVERQFPGTTTNGSIDRKKLSEHVVGNEAAIKKLEAIVHPLVRQKEEQFRKTMMNEKIQLAVLDIPLLFETGREERMDAIIVVSAAPEIQRQRVLAREGMTEEKFLSILGRQTPDDIKRKKADFVIDTSLGIENAKQQVSKIIKILKSPDWSKTENSNA